MNVMVQSTRLELMSAVTSGVSTGSSLALVYKVLDWASTHPPVPFCDLSWRLDGFSFALGLASGLLIYAAIEAAVTLKWAFVSWVASYQVAPTEVRRPKELYKLL